MLIYLFAPDNEKEPFFIYCNLFVRRMCGNTGLFGLAKGLPVLKLRPWRGIGGHDGTIIVGFIEAGRAVRKTLSLCKHTLRNPEVPVMVNRILPTSI